ncbi:hypothetical protein LBWT_X4590 (plasmid) [Leptolyngbya boryana IAM M-101]|nr:hypothetical protein LBWT_X4590 [Leptolyngbya boryana IAM M-101]BAS66735.1 hypothetical protein LBDG_X4590 [Leptolyngbya boryana dg5]
MIHRLKSAIRSQNPFKKRVDQPHLATKLSIGVILKEELDHFFNGIFARIGGSRG